MAKHPKNHPVEKKLQKHEADRALAARSEHSVVLTNELKETPGPLKDAYKRGWKVLYLKDYEASGQSLGDFIEAAWNSWLPRS